VTADGRRGSTAVRRPGTLAQTATYPYRRYGYYERTYPRYGRYPSYGRYYCSSYYPSSGFYLGFTWGVGAYIGWRYYYPYYHCGSGLSFAFFYGDPITYAYVPYGFYYDTTPVYVTRYVYVHDTYPETQYEVVEAEPPAAEPAEGQEVVEPTPAAGTPVVEKYLREASDAFHKADYLEAAKLFRLAALSAPENAAPLFALGQALIAIGSDAYAARVIRKAIAMNPGLVKEPGDIVGVYQTEEEFERVLGELQKRAEESAAGSDARFLLAVEHYFSGDPKAVEDLRLAAAASPDDEAVKILLEGAEKRFAAGEDLPPLDPAAEPK